MPVTVFARTLGQTVDGALRLVGDYRGDGKDGFRWSRAEARFRADRVILSLFDTHQLAVTTALLAVSADKRLYDLPGDCLRPLRLAYFASTACYVLAGATYDRIDLAGCLTDASGTPAIAYRDRIPPGKVAVWPVPTAAGSTVTIEGDATGVLTALAVDGVAVPADADAGAIAGMDGAVAVGADGVATDAVVLSGNLELTYLREPEKWSTGGDRAYPDPILPEWFHPKLRYGLALALLPVARTKRSQARQVLLSWLWGRAKGRLGGTLSNARAASSWRPM